MTDPVIQFRSELAESFGPLDWLPIPNGKIHRFHVPGDRVGTRNGWYVLHLDGIACGSFGSWKESGSRTWSSRRAADPEEAQLIARRKEQDRQQHEADQYLRQLKTAGRAHRLWRNARRADPNHPYLIAKGVQPHGLRQHRDELLVPLYAGGVLVNLQRIAPDGSKLFLFGGRIKGAYSPLGRITPGKLLGICEGWATGATLHESGYTVACAMNAGNLKAVALALRAKYYTTEIIIAGDDDRQTKGNPGRTAANAAAVAVGGQVTFPEWPADAPDSLSDFNDLAVWSRRHA
ncbi:toprim domain-containing protein [Pseudomonas fluorescens]|uniref:toprim domain-containing protein n=1 Tax=Pseudomonas fluorescens TaxID=294 RepID=UPI00123F8B4B|nr:toprim domain-containing protein [Pseudomonas fluorescens]